MTESILEKGHVVLVGAGPGDIGLLTLRGKDWLVKADVVIYDHLVNINILHFASSAELIYVGKKSGHSTITQNEINELLIAKAQISKVIVRLKGGDPFIFGRGAEEMEFVANFGIETAMVPGISSSMAVPAYQNIPLTKRGSAESFWVITGTTKEHQLSNDVALAATSDATVVILMGMGKLPEIIKLFQQENKNESPVAIIQNGTRSNEKVGFGTVDTILEVVKENELSNPAIIVLGEVVKHSAILKNVQQEYLKEVFA